MTIPIFAIVDKFTNRAYLITTSPNDLNNFMQQNGRVNVELIEIQTIGTSYLGRNNMDIKAYCITPLNPKLKGDSTFLTKDYYLIKDIPEEITLEEAYKMIKE